MFRRGAGLIGGCVAALALPLLALGLNLPLWLSALVAVAIGVGVWLVAPGLLGGAKGGLEDEAVLEARSEAVRELLRDGQAALDRLRAAARLVKDGDMKGGLNTLAASADRVLAQVRSDPDRAMAVRRLMSFYLPNAASLAEGWRSLEDRSAPSDARMAQTRDTVKALNQAFTRFEDQAAEPQLKTLDLDLKVLNDALKSDLERS